MSEYIQNSRSFDRKIADDAWEASEDIRMGRILDRPEKTTDNNNNEIDIVALKERFRGEIGSTEYFYLLNVATAAGLTVGREMLDDVNFRNEHERLKAAGAREYYSAQMTAHYATWMQWVVSLPDEQWPAGHSQPEFFIWAEEQKANMEIAGE